MELMEALEYQEKGLVSILLKQTQNFVCVCIIMLIAVIYLLIGKKSLSLKPIMMLTFQLNFVLEVFLMDLVQLSLENYLQMEMHMFF